MTSSDSDDRAMRVQIYSLLSVDGSLKAQQV